MEFEDVVIHKNLECGETHYTKDTIEGSETDLESDSECYEGETRSYIFKPMTENYVSNNPDQVKYNGIITMERNLLHALEL